ncbi:MAG: pseudouridylate synthase [Cyclobacteriaceae bacterium]
MSSPEPFFIPFKQSISQFDLPQSFNNPFRDPPHPLAKHASQELQQIIKTRNWNHNFGLDSDPQGQTIGKMFGVLVVKQSDGSVGYLAAFSGKIGGRHEYPGFVPPVWEGLRTGGLLEMGMKELNRLNQDIEMLGDGPENGNLRIALQKARTDHSNSLQAKIYDGYQFLNRAGEVKSLREIFINTHHSNPPGGAGDCAAPKLLQYAFEHQMIPLTIAEFWWGHSSDSPQWKHRSFYPPCKHKCDPILRHMLNGLGSPA